jgi:hypothetical protein
LFQNGRGLATESVKKPELPKPIIWNVYEIASKGVSLGEVEAVSIVPKTNEAVLLPLYSSRRTTAFPELMNRLDGIRRTRLTRSGRRTNPTVDSRDYSCYSIVYSANKGLNRLPETQRDYIAIVPSRRLHGPWRCPSLEKNAAQHRTILSAQKRRRDHRELPIATTTALPTPTDRLL